MNYKFIYPFYYISIQQSLLLHNPNQNLKATDYNDNYNYIFEFS